MEEYKTSRDSYGILITPDIKLHRTWFKEMVRLIGVNVIYKAPITSTKEYNNVGEIISKYHDPKLVGCIFEEHPNQKTTRKLGWNSERQEDFSIIHVPYDLEGLQQGALFIIPSGLDDGKGRVFRLVDMSTIMIYPASIPCKLVPEFENNFDQSQMSHSKDTFNLLKEEEGYY